MGFGLASAGIVATSLQDLAYNRVQHLPDGFSRAKLIRDLLSFVSHLESLSDDSAYAAAPAFSDAAKALSRAVDDVLEPHDVTGPNGEAASLHVSSGGVTIHSAQSSYRRSADVQGHTPMERSLFAADGMGDLDLNAWLNTLDWNGVTENWIDF